MDAPQVHDQSSVVMRLVNVEEMAAILGVPVSWLYQRTCRNAIPCIRVGKYLRFETEVVLAHLKERSQANVG